MEPTLETLSDELKKRNIRLSHQRIKVLEYLTKNQCHPTVEQIYCDLLQEVPTLSKTTVYNTLKSLADARLVNILTIEDNEMRYDIITENHGHFKCEKCKSIINFNINAEALSTDDLSAFRIHERNVYFKGVCPGCLFKINDYKEV